MEVSDLTPREKTICAGVHAGKTNREIAEDLGLTVNTVKQYVFRVFARLSIKRRAELALMVEREKAAAK